jgi:hypothetical protein
MWPAFPTSEYTSQSDFHPIIKPFSPHQLGRSYKLALEPDGSPLFPSNSLVACWRYEPRGGSCAAEAAIGDRRGLVICFTLILWILRQPLAIETPGCEAYLEHRRHEQGADHRRHICDVGIPDALEKSAIAGEESCRGVAQQQDEPLQEAAPVGHSSSSNRASGSRGPISNGKGPSRVARVVSAKERDGVSGLFLPLPILSLDPPTADVVSPWRTFARMGAHCPAEQIQAGVLLVDPAS